jgi:ribonuclease E
MVSSPRVVSSGWLAAPLLAALAGPVAAQSVAPEGATAAPGASPVVQVPAAAVQPPTVQSPTLGQRIDPIVPPVQRVAPALAPSVRAVAGAVVTPVRRQAANGVNAAAMKAVAAKTVPVRSVPTAAVPAAAVPSGPAPAAQAAGGVQAVGPMPAVATQKKSARSGLLSPNLRSALGRPPTAATKPAKPILSRVTAAARSAALRAKPRR